MNVILFVGIAAFLSGLCVGFRELLTSPTSVNYPTQSPPVRAIAWLLAMGLCYRGVVVVLSVVHGHPRLDDASVWVGSSLSFAYFASGLIDTLDDRAPARAWRRMNQIHAVMRCRRWGWLRRAFGLPPQLETPDPARAAMGAAMVAMDMDAGLVIAPNEVPKEWRPPG